MTEQSRWGGSSSLFDRSCFGIGLRVVGEVRLSRFEEIDE
jgi:hypothetical protein